MNSGGIGPVLGGMLGGWLLMGILWVTLALVLPAPEIGELLRAMEDLPTRFWQFVQVNLRGSLLPFAAVLLVFVLQFRKLDRELAECGSSFTRVVRGEHALDQCAGLFFGIGVIWTAIGMRDALLFALGGQEAVIGKSAFSVLQRLVDGGILLALSTTIVGAVGGYLMRIVKSIVLGERLAARYIAESARPARETLQSLMRIEHTIAARYQDDPDVGEGT
jgi:hypothetical protein